MTEKQQPDDMTPDGFSKFMRPSAERDELIRQLTTPVNQPKKLPSEKLYTQCGACKGTGNQWDVDIKNIERAARQIRVDCRLCEGKGYFESGLHTGQIDMLATSHETLKRVGWLIDDKLKESAAKETELFGNEEVDRWEQFLYFWFGVRDLCRELQGVMKPEQTSNT